MLTSDYVHNALRMMGQGLPEICRHAHPKHHRAIETYQRFIDQLLTHLEQQEKQMSIVTDALNKRTNERDQWKAYAQAQAGAVADAQAKEKTAEDALAAIPIATDAEDKANVDAVIAAPDDLPPT